MKNVSASGQDYLEAILDLSKENKRIKSTHVAEKLGVTRASTNRAMGVLSDAGYIEKQPYSEIFLTEKGRIEANSVKERHMLLKSFFIDVLGVKKEIAEEDACKIEHAISKETFEKLKIFLNNTIR